MQRGDLGQAMEEIPRHTEAVAREPDPLPIERTHSKPHLSVYVRARDLPYTIAASLGSAGAASLERQGVWHAAASPL